MLILYDFGKNPVLSTAFLMGHLLHDLNLENKNQKKVSWVVLSFKKWDRIHH